MNHKQEFRFGQEVVSINCREKLSVDTLKDEDKIKTYLIKSPLDVHALVQCTVKYIIVLYLGLGSGYVKYKKTGSRNSFCFKLPDNNLESFLLTSYEHNNITNDYGNGTNNGVIQYHNGIFYIKKGAE